MVNGNEGATSTHRWTAPIDEPPNARQHSRRLVLLAPAAIGLGLAGAATLGAGPAAAKSSRTQGSRATGAPSNGISVNVLDHGARGDGVTDDVEAFRSAMALLGEAGGGTFVVPGNRTYLINEIVFLVDNVHITSDGATLTKTTGRHTYFASLSGSKKGYGSGVRNVKVDGLTFKGDFAAPFVACGFALHHAQDVTVENCVFTETEGTGHCLDLCGCDRITVRKCRFYGFDNFKGDWYNRVEYIQLDQSRAGAPSVNDNPAGYDGLFTRNVLVEDCQFLPLEVNGIHYPCGNPIGAHSSREAHRYENIAFIGNHIEDPHEDPSTQALDEQNTTGSWKGVTHFPTVHNLVISDNTFVQHSPGSVRAIAIFSIDVSDLDAVPPSQRPVQGPVDPIASENITITNNRFTGFRPSASALPQEVIWIHGVEGGEAGNITIVGNTFENTRSSDGRGTVAVRALNCHNLTVVNNTFTDSAGGVLLEHSTRFTVVNNSVSAGSGPQLPAAIAVTDGSNHGSVSKNRTSGFSRPVSLTGAGPDVTVKGNT